MITIEKLNNFGADTAEGLQRCYGNETLYFKLINMLLAEGSFDKLKDAAETNDLNAGFEAAHALKGVLGNLSLTPMYDKIYEITELMRAKTEMDYRPLVAEVLAMRDELAALCA